MVESNDELKKELGRFLKSIRKQKGKTASEISKQMQYSQGHISGIENGVKSFPSNKLIESYLMNIKDTNEEYNFYVDEIAKITKNKVKLNKVSNATNKMEIIDRMMDIPYSREFISFDDNNEKSFTIFNISINDLHFHLQDINNYKFYKGIRLTDNDKNNIDKILNNYFENKSVIIKENTKTLRDKNENWEQLVKLSDYIDDKLDKKN
ncbi:TPA: helix-turn-helix domain-containing protein [Staphylococcus aureus]|nr:helix-turn-helix domain-containing protein [Staphylococcus aureus]HDT7097645.1 helix-turn-helix domain-containing protein [Staphylococcus aureus]HDT7102615.1 helix-turn-helix domain-containing protein [Staphylococcus aureus]HDT7104814.1 helix-turn-helix domain-containing protein [Staphylococcus aureus]HDT7108445.1 helix-turn-helix domain-containing protein [Staphylococcus aureus]